MKKVKILFFNSRKYDFSTATLVEGFNQLKDAVELRATNLGSYALPEQVLSGKEVTEYASSQADIIILGSNHYVDHKTFWKVGSERAKKVYVDGWDSGQLNINPMKYRKFNYIFKNNLYKRDNSIAGFMRIITGADLTLWDVPRSHILFPYPFFHSMKNMTGIKDVIKNFFYVSGQHKVFPLPFSVEKRCQADFNESPKYMLSCMLSADRVPERRKIIDMLKDMQLPDIFIGKIEEDEECFLKMEKMYGADPNVPQGLRGYAFHNDAYYKQIHQSRACISVPGGGFDTFRFWEILGAGALLISKRIAIRMPDPPVENKHYLAFDTIEELDDCIRRLYEFPEKMDEIRWEGYQHAGKYHTTRSRAEYFLKTVTALPRYH